MNQLRRRLLAALPALALARSAAALQQALPAQGAVRLDRAQTRAFQAWVLRIVSLQLERGPTPRWPHRDCAGLVRFAVNEALTPHDARWLRANGLAHDALLPPELELSAAQAGLRNHWRRSDGKSGPFVTALGLVQNNSRFIGHDIGQAEAADLLFFDQGSEQHLMLWMGRTIAYHTGTVTPQDNGLRAVEVQRLLNWKDTRWQPTSSNPNFAGLYRLAFLA